MKTVPHFLREPLRNAMKVVLEEISRFGESGRPQTGTGVEGVLVVAQAASP